MERIIFGLLFVIIFSCTPSNENDKISKEQTDSETDSSSLDEASSDTIFIPSAFERLIEHMDSLGYDPDTTFFDETMYQDGKIHLVNYESHFIHEFLSDKEKYEGVIFETPYSPQMDSMFAKVEDIRLFPWRMPDTPEGLMRNGIVEEWTFPSEADAKKVFEFLEREQKSLGFPFPKTRAYYFLALSTIYMFHSPNSGVAYRHQQFYEWIKHDFYYNGLPQPYRQASTKN